MITNAPLVVVASFYRHNAATAAKHVRHIKYIATRAGVDRGAAREDLSPEDVPPGTHAGYIAERPGSDGLFGYRDISSYKEMQHEIEEHRGLSWRLIVSLRADDATRLGYDNGQKWEEVIRSQIYTAGEKMGIGRDNLRWAAAFHVHPDRVNCHVHIVLWEKDTNRTTGKLAAQELKDIKRCFGGEIFREERLSQMQAKSLMREYVRENAKGSVSAAKELFRALKAAGKEGELELKTFGFGGMTSLPPELVKEKELSIKLAELARAMPGRGRVALKFQPPEVKQQARDAAAWIMKQPHFYDHVKRHGDAAERLASVYTRNPIRLQAARGDAYNDLRDRVANILLRGARDISNTAIKENIAAGKTAKTCWQAAWRAVQHERIKSEAQAELQQLKGLRKDRATQRYQDYSGQKAEREV